MSLPAGMSAGQLRRLLDDGSLTSAGLTGDLLETIARIDGGIGAFLRVNPRAEEEAAAADRRISDGETGPLLGIPVAVKDNLCTADLETTCGSRILEGFLPLEDCTAVARLRAAGAVVLGKTNMDEFGMGSSTENSAFAPTRNPWDPGRVPGGSSGGSAAAVSARMTPLALGSDTGGSVRQPAAFCGVVGIKPTYGRVSRSGLVAFGSSLDQIGPLSRNVSDCARLLSVIAGPDERDATSAQQPVGDYVAACSRGVEGLRVGMPREYFSEGLSTEIETAVRAAAESLERAGARIEQVSLPHTRYAIPTYYLVATAEASSNLARYDGVRFGRRSRDCDDLPAMYRQSRTDGFGAEVKRRVMLGTYALSAGYYDEFYGKASRVRTLLRGDFLDLFSSGIDALLTPVTPTTAFAFDDKMDDPLAMYLSDVFTVTASLSGLPALAVPVGISDSGLPVGAQLIGPDFDEETLFRAAGVIELAFPTQTAPTVP